MQVPASLRGRIMIGFIALLCVSVAGFAVTLYIATGFKEADAERTYAIGQMRRAAAMDRLACLAQHKLSEYLRTGSADSRNDMTASFSRLSAAMFRLSSKVEAEELQAQAARTVQAIDKATLAGRHLIDTAASLSNPSAAIGRWAADANDAPGLASAASRMQVSIGLAASAAAQRAATGGDKAIEELTAEQARIRQALLEMDADPKASPRLRRLTAFQASVMDLFAASIDAYSVSLAVRGDDSRTLDILLKRIADASAEQEQVARLRFDVASATAAQASQGLLRSLPLIAFVVCIVGIALAMILGGSIARPIVALKDAILRIADADFDAGVPGRERRDEIGRMANAVQTFKENGLRLEQMNADLAKAKSAADEANLSKTRFLAAASHDLLQPLNAARLYATSLRERVRSTSAPDEHLQLALHVEESLEAVEEILTALLDISRLDAGAMRAELTAFPIDDLLRQLRVEFGPVAEEKGIAFSVVRSSIAVRSDRRLLGRMLQNLISNAIKYTAEGRVIVGVRRKAGRAHVEVWDTGLGIPTSKQDVIFAEFARLPEAVKAAPGVGLGLSIVRRLGKVLGHEVAVRSKSRRGSVFTVAVPRANGFKAGPGPATHGAASRRLPLAGLVVVSIDDEPTILGGMEALLEGWGCTLALGHDLASAQRDMDGRQLVPDVIIADYHLGDANGIVAIATLRERYGNVPALLVTADHASDVRELAKTSHIRLLNKPLKPAVLRSLLSQQHLLKEKTPAHVNHAGRPEPHMVEI